MTASLQDGYVVRRFRPKDRDRFLSLYATVWGREKTADWFDWRFEQNPYEEGVEMVVAERNGDLIGAEPLLPFRIRLGSRELRAYQPVDWIVHPDHRRQGLFTRMTERLIERYTERADLLFNFPNEMLLPGLRKFDWRAVGPIPQTYRVQNPSALLARRAKTDDTPLESSVVKLGAPFVNGWVAVLDRLGGSSGDVAVERHTSVPVAELVRLSAGDSHDRFHVSRDREFYEWRFENPRWETATYLARRNGTPVASVVVATERIDRLRCTQLLDIQPACERRADPEAFAALLREIIADNRDADVLKAPPLVYSQTLRNAGFWRDDAFPLSTVATRTTHVVRPLADEGDPEWHVGGRDLTDPDNWLLTIADLDVA